MYHVINYTVKISSLNVGDCGINEFETFGQHQKMALKPLWRTPPPPLHNSQAKHTSSQVATLHPTPPPLLLLHGWPTGTCGGSGSIRAGLIDSGHA